jgi:hypothetical protein
MPLSSFGEVENLAPVLKMVSNLLSQTIFSKFSQLLLAQPGPIANDM